MTRWWARASRVDPARRLYCFPPAGGGIQGFLSWRNALPDAVEVCAAQLPGRGARFLEPTIPSFTQLVDHFSQSIVAEADRPFLLLGHSLGALMAFEVTRSLSARGAMLPQHLIVSGCGAPHLHAPKTRYHELDDARLIAELVHFNGTSRDILDNQELMQLLLPAIRSDFALFSAYRYRPAAKLELPITVLAGGNDDHVERQHVAEWHTQTTASCAIHWLAGGHFFIDENRAGVLAVLHAIFARTEPAARGSSAGRYPA